MMKHVSLSNKYFLREQIQIKYETYNVPSKESHNMYYKTVNSPPNYLINWKKFQQHSFANFN